LQFHFTDNEGYRLPSDKFPNLPSIGANGERLHYSKEEIAKLVVYAKKYHVLIQPEIEMPGHAGAISSALPQTRCSIAKGACAELCIGSDESCKAMQAIIEEVMGMFPGPYWHLGGDEANHGLWQGCAACQKRIKDADLKDTVGLYNDFVNRMNTFVKSKGRRMMIWEGFRPDSKPTVDKDIIVFPYDINLREGARPMDYLDAGYTVVNASWKPLYLVWHMHVPEPEALAKWDACQFKSYHDDGKYGVYPMTEPWIVKQTPQLLGGQLHSLENHQNVLPGWLFGTGPYVENQRKWQPAPRIQIVAERLWTGTKTTPEDLLRRAGVKEK
jgi:hexosaminidase